MRSHRTTPAPSRTRRCLVTACRVMSVPAVSREIDWALPADSRPSIDSLVSSPSAANTVARVFSAAAPLRGFDMASDVLHLRAPAAVVHAERFVAAVARDLVEAGFNHTEPGSGRNGLQGEF